MMSMETLFTVSFGLVAILLNSIFKNGAYFLHQTTTNVLLG